MYVCYHLFPSHVDRIWRYFEELADELRDRTNEFEDLKKQLRESAAKMQNRVHVQACSK